MTKGLVADPSALDIIGTNAGWMTRDRAMADNNRWILGHEGPDAKMVVPKSMLE